jgi:hypothetical protein
MLLALLIAAAPTWSAPGEPDTDRDGLADFHELHKYFTDPKQADSDGDGVPDGDWGERREFTYSVRAVMHVMAPFDVASMTDDYQDVRVLAETPDLLEFEVVVYPFNTVTSTLESTARWNKPAAELRPFVAPGVCCNWDAKMQAQLLSELKRDGIDVGALDDAAAARAVSKWLLERAVYEDSFTTFAIEFQNGKPSVTPRQQQNMEQTLQRFGRTLQQQFDRELFGKGMFETKLRGSCTSSAIYLSTGLKAIGLPARTIVCTPIVDANDEREVAWIGARIAHVGVRSVIAQAAEQQRGSWTSHTFNEVYVGKRWRRLNYTNLGQNVLEGDSLGLMVHVHTFNDHSQAGLVGWGNREVHPQHAQLFGGPNPYSCVSLSDFFGPHCKIVNEHFGTLREALITRVYWYDDPERQPKLTTDLGDPDGSGYFFAHIDARGATNNASEFSAFFRDADKRFVLRANGKPDVPAQAIMKYWVDFGNDVNEFILRIAAGDLARMEPGVRYALHWVGGDGLRWRIADGVTIARPKR